MGATMTNVRLFTVKQVADHLDVSERTVLNWLRSGRLKGYRLGGTKAGWRIEEPDLQTFIAQLKGQQSEELR
jgi:excisionase family DNA binding protein